MRRASLPVMLAVTLAASGCGQKGPLYLPDKNAKVATAPAAGTTAAAAPQTPPTPKPTDKDHDPQPPPK